MTGSAPSPPAATATSSISSRRTNSRSTCGSAQDHGDLLHAQHAAAHALAVRARCARAVHRLLRARAVQRHPGLAGSRDGHDDLFPVDAARATCGSITRPSIRSGAARARASRTTRVTARSIYARDGDALYVNLFIASTLDWRERGLTVMQETRFPDEDTTRLTFPDRSKRAGTRAGDPPAGLVPGR